MIAEFEQRLADVLAARLPLPYTGRVAVAPGPETVTQTMLIVGVQKAEILEEDFLGHRSVSLPGETAVRRVVHLRCTVSVEALSETGRTDLLHLLDAALYLLDSADFRNAGVLADGEDRGFLIHRMSVAGISIPFARLPETPRAISLVAEGWFWPVGVPGEEGEAIRDALVRGGLLPIQLAAPPMVAGGGPYALTIRFSGSGTLSLREGEAPRTLPFGLIALALRDSGGRPGAGSLAGGTEGAEGVRLMEWSGSDLTVTYTPPPAPALDFLIVGVDNGEQGLGAVLARFPLNVREG
ncbi:MAG: hypothetical protein HGA84_02110 [Syntrophobacteraceae bacterium]|nr:hypothetical protein [Syntrophobacteraceae bacterium]